MNLFLIFIIIFVTSCSVNRKIENKNQEEIMNNFELISSENYKLISKRAIIKNNNYFLFDTKIYFEDIYLYSSKINVLNNYIFSKDLIINNKNFIIKSKKSTYRNKIFKLEKVKAKF